MGLIDIVAGRAMGLDVGRLAAQVGMSEDHTRTVLASLGKHHTEPGDPVVAAAAETGTSRDTVARLLAALGGESALAKVSVLASGGGLSDMLEDK